MKIYYYLFIALVVFTAPAVMAQTASPEPSLKEISVTPKVSPTGEKLDAEVDKIKEKVEKTVLGMKDKTDEVVSGFIKTIKGEDVTLTTEEKDRAVTLDNTLTSYFEIQGTTAKEIKKDSLKKNDYIFVLGPDINGSITANAVYKDQKYLALAGKITEVNSDDFSIKIVTLDKSTYTIDVQTRTNQELLNIKTVETEKIGFSKLKEGDSIHVIVKANNENPTTTRFDAERILVIPNEFFMQ
jgi:hypothetical protein